MRVLDSDITEHAQKRESLIAAERSLRFDDEVITKATENEKRAVEIVNNLRMREAKEIWKASKGRLIYPRSDFLTAKEIIMNTELYQIMKRLPKGGLLRGHTVTMSDVGFIYQLALEYPAIHIRVNSRISCDTLLPLPEFKPLSPDLVAAYASNPPLTCTDYVLGTWVPLSKARSEFVYGGPEAFDKWIIGSLAVSPDEGSKGYKTPVKVVQRFLASYRLARGITCYEPILKRSLRQTMLSLFEDGVCYAEIRVNFSYKADIWTDGSETLSHHDYLALFGNVVREVKDQMKLEGREDEFIGAKLIYTVYRTFDKDKLWWYLEDCMALKTEFPDLIAGFDLLGPEDTGNPLSYYLEPLLWFREETRNRGLDIPFIFLAGESMGDEGMADNNIYDALLLGTKRIGHGLNLAKHPLLMQMIKEQGVAVEVCPITDEILGLISPTHHPLTTLLNHGLPVVLCPDNPASFGYAGLSFDFFQAIVGSKSTNILSLKQLAKQSLQSSSLDAEEKKIALEAWEKRWLAFVDEIVSKDLESEH
ncbi:adenosine deaminase-like protein [Rhizoctonia solani AG-3 Rhs1AP]|uniref:adenosine deaminase n=1 Tax=Rhizoctonia solani AG-3 Rhs1AP TaxID=1086054 RepID=X8JJR9_9AGAM|nr:adenosine deaminase-like protein [Rhizoctonia solani AG-3 Rhs1AP]